MNKFMDGLILGAVAMIIVCVIAFANSMPNQKFREIKELKEKCEESLPRNEHCVIIALPQSKD